MSAPAVDLTKIKFTPMGLVWLFLAIVAALLVAGTAQYAVARLKARVPAVAKYTSGDAGASGSGASPAIMAAMRN